MPWWNQLVEMQVIGSPGVLDEACKCMPKKSPVFKKKNDIILVTTRF